MGGAESNRRHAVAIGAGVLVVALVLTTVGASIVPALSSVVGGIHIEFGRLGEGESEYTVDREVEVTPPSPPDEFRGPTVTGSAAGLSMEASLSSDEVALGERLGVELRFTGDGHFETKRLRMTVLDAEERKAYDILILLRDRPPGQDGPPPDENVRHVSWEVGASETADFRELTPGEYTVTLTTSEPRIALRHTVEVLE